MSCMLWNELTVITGAANWSTPRARVAGLMSPTLGHDLWNWRCAPSNHQTGSVCDSRWSWLQQILGHTSVHFSYSWGQVRWAKRDGCWLCEISISSTNALIYCDVQPILTGYRCDLWYTSRKGLRLFFLEFRVRIQLKLKFLADSLWRRLRWRLNGLENMETGTTGIFPVGWKAKDV